MVLARAREWLRHGLIDVVVAVGEIFVGVLGETSLEQIDDFVLVERVYIVQVTDEGSKGNLLIYAQAVQGIFVLVTMFD